MVVLLGFSRIFLWFYLVSLLILSLFLFDFVFWRLLLRVVVRFVLCYVMLCLFVLFVVLCFCGDFDSLLGFACPIFVNELYLLRLEEFLGS
jgi:hypothetical protein